MNTLKQCLRIVPALGMLAGIAGFQAVSAEEYVSKAKAKTLLQAELPGVAGKEVIIRHFTQPPKFVGGKHMHPGPVFVYVLKGELTVETQNGTKTVKAGELYPEEIGVAMLARNSSDTNDVELLVFQVGDIGKPMMIKVK